MNVRIIGFIILTLAGLLLMNCSKKEDTILNPRLLITLKDTAGISVAGATVRLYKNAQDTGITQISDSNGVVIYRNLDAVLYYWFAEKGCATNKNSQNTLGRPLIPNAILYGYSVMSETGTLKIINTSAEPYEVSDSLFNVTLSADTTYILYPTIGPHIIHSENVTTPEIGNDSLIQIVCGDTTVLRIPY